MKARNRRFETIPPQLVEGELRLLPNDVEFRRTRDRKAILFPLESQYYLRCFMAGLSIQEIVTKTYARGEHVDFLVLKETLFHLYKNRCIVNKNDFAWGLEYSDGPPLRDGHLLEPFAEFQFEDESFWFQMVLLLIPIVSVFFTLNILFQKDVPALALMLFPMTFLNLKGGISAAINTLMSTHPYSLSLHLSPFGLYLRSASGERPQQSLKEYLLHTLTLATLVFLSLRFFMRSEIPTFHEFGPLLTLIVTCALLSPTQNTEASHLRFLVLRNRIRGQIEGLLGFVTTGFYYLSIAIYTGLTLYYCVQAFLGVTNLYQHFLTGNPPTLLTLFFQAVIVISAFSLLMDVFDEGEIVFDSTRWPKVPSLQTSIRQAVRRHKKDQHFSEAISTLPIFKNLPEKTLNKMAQLSKIYRYKAGTRIFSEGDTSKELYLVIDGSVGIFKKGSDQKRHRIVQIKEGGLFGEGAFLLDRPRSGDAYALVSTTVLKIKKPNDAEDPENKQIERLEGFQKKIWSFQALAQSDLFKEQPDELLMPLISYGEVIDVPAGKTLIQKGDLPNALYILIQGNCQISIDGEDVRRVGPREVLGEIGLIWNTRRTSTVVTTAPTIFLRIQAHDLWEILGKNLNLAIAMQQIGEYRLHTQAA